MDSDDDDADDATATFEYDPTAPIRPEDDEDISEDEAFDTSDDEKYDFLLRKAKPVQAATKAAEAKRHALAEDDVGDDGILSESDGGDGDAGDDDALENYDYTNPNFINLDDMLDLPLNEEGQFIPDAEAQAKR
ncbi:hypothetical protein CAUPRSCDRAFT_13211, partial [Caulochytrium protostelioides]